MKLKFEEITVESGGIRSSQKFGIKDMGFILELLRSKLYKNPIEAICREVSCNCLDANNEAGKNDVPVEIDLPNTFQPFIVFRDFGIGISPERMKDIFLNYGESSKRNSNAQIGGFGLGAKTPFSYVDSFSITTISEDRIKRIYNAFIDPSRQGDCALLSESPAAEDESTGTSITIPVQPKDFHLFTQAVVKFTKYWEVRPILSGQTPLPKYPEMKEVLSGDNWKIYDSRSLGGNLAGLVVVISGVPYEIDLNQLSDAGIEYDFYRLRDLGLHLYFQTGELTVSASRDTLYFDESTTKLVSERINLALDKVHQKLLDRIAHFTTYREAAHFVQTNNDFFRRFDFILQLHNKNLEWQGKILYRSPLSRSAIGEYARIVTYHKNGKSDKTASLDFSAETLLIRDDTLKSTLSPEAIKKLFQDYPDFEKVQIVFTPQRPNNAQWRREEENGTADPPTYQTEILDWVEAEKLSDILVGKIRRASPRKSDNKIKIYELSLGKFRPKKVDPDSLTGFYFEIEPVGRKGEHQLLVDGTLFAQLEAEKQSQFIKACKSYFDVNEILFIPAKLIKKCPNVKSMQEKIAEKFSTVDWEKVQELIFFSYKQKNIFHAISEISSSFEEFEKNIVQKIETKDNNPFYELYSCYSGLMQEMDQNQDLMLICQNLKSSIRKKFQIPERAQKDTIDQEFSRLIERIYRKYPVLFLRRFHTNNVKENIFANYINLIDWLEKQTNQPNLIPVSFHKDSVNSGYLY